MLFILLLIAKKVIKIDCPDNAVDFLKYDVDGMLQTIDSYLRNFDKHKGSDKFKEDERKGIIDRWQILSSRTSNLSEYLSQTWK